MTMVHSPDYFAYAYAVLVTVGGIIGFLRKGSLPSLTIGLLTGMVLLYAAYQVSLNPQNATLGFVVCAFLAAVMGFRFFKTGAFMPAGLVAGLSVAMGGRYLLKIINS